MARNQFRALGIIGALVAVGSYRRSRPWCRPVTIAVDRQCADRSPGVGGSVDGRIARSRRRVRQHRPRGEVREPATNEDPDEDEAKPDKAAKPEKGPEAPDHPVTLTGVVGQASGDGEFTLTVGFTAYELSAGPKWWWGGVSSRPDRPA